VFILSNLLSALAILLEYFFTILSWLIIIRALLSWVSPDPFNPIVQIINKTTEPILAPFRRLIPMYNIGLDLSPLIALLVILFLKIFLVKTIADIAFRLR